jgi:hypothetical protein
MSTTPPPETHGPKRERFGDLFALSVILDTALKDTEYKLDERATASLRYSLYGSEIYADIVRKLPEADARLVHLAMICEFYWSQIFFDYGSTDVVDLVSDITRGLKTRKIILPYVFGGMLYQKASRLLMPMKDVLAPNETKSLLSGTPQGVFQMRAFVTGPLGLLLSVQERDFRPRRSAPLWHCSDPSCTAIHFGDFQETAGPLKSIRQELRQLLGSHGERMPYGDLGYHHVNEEVDYYDDMHTGDLAPLLGDAFSLSELRALLKGLLDRTGGLRARISKMNIGMKLGSAQQVSDALDLGECLQLILLERDQNIIETLERLIEREVIKIPFSELRTPQSYHSRSGWYGIRCEASRYGVRFATKPGGMPLARLKKVVTKIYEPSGNIGELAWKLRYVPGETASQRLDHYVEKTDPETVIREHVFGSAGAPEQAFKAMKYGYFPDTFSREQEPHIVKKLIWKLGFDVPVYPLEYKRLSENVNTLREVSNSRSTRGNEDVLAIRSAAVNFFVELESFLGAALAFMYWVLMSDHYRITKFVYEKTRSQAEMVKAFATFQETSGASEPIKFDEAGNNTLYPLICGFRLLAEICREASRERSQYIRASTQTPGYVGKSELQVFPFTFTKLFLDLRENIATQVLSHLIEISDLLQNCNVAGIRNRAEHARDDFPNATEIASMLDTISSLTDRMQKNGSAPLSYVLSGSKVDAWG